MKIISSEKAFLNAVKNKNLSKDKNSKLYVGKFMYMYSVANKDYF